MPRRGRGARIASDWQWLSAPCSGSVDRLHTVWVSGTGLALVLALPVKTGVGHDSKNHEFPFGCTGVSRSSLGGTGSKLPIQGVRNRYGPERGDLVGASVTLSNLNTGVKTVRNSSESGLFVFDLVDPGAYSVTVEATGFSKFVQEKIQVQTRDDITVNASLRPGAIAESVTVTGEAVAVQFNSASRDLTIDTKLAEEIRGSIAIPSS